MDRHAECDESTDAAPTELRAFLGFCLQIYRADGAKNQIVIYLSDRVLRIK